MFKYYDSLGFMNPYYVVGDDKFAIENSFEKIIAKLDAPRQIDVAAVVEIISRYHCFGDRTLVKGIFRTPWMAKPSEDNTEWEFAQVPPHDEKITSEEELAGGLFSRLQEEILEYCEGKSTVGLLLSGGMDSRIAAGVLDYLIKTNQINVNVVAITWGVDQSRDVVYAQEIARRLGWEWKHYQLSPDDLIDNIAHTAKRGCEYSPIHLHAMPRVRDLQGVDCILAASFGDSVGRAEFSGRHVTDLFPINRYVFNWFKLLKTNAYRRVGGEIDQGVETYHALFPRKKAIQQMEVEQQAHYMRRMLNPCMAVINEKIPLLQIFSKPSVFGFMWSWSPKVRNDTVYRCILDLFETSFLDIPWARTGKKYLSQETKFDDLSKYHNHYGQWIKNDIYEIVESKVLSDYTSGLNIFNMDSLKNSMKANKRLSKQVEYIKLDEIFIWIAALADFVKMYEIQGIDSRQATVDGIDGNIVAPIQVVGYVGVNNSRKFRKSRRKYN
ncbi:MAG: hypothetical protein GY832_32500 [Chloroflexi bacterium]|nr:hypothetical protein [Chloroflexota bacterium]